MPYTWTAQSSVLVVVEAPYTPYFNSRQTLNSTLC